jgi:hypothetical protein
LLLFVVSYEKIFLYYYYYYSSNIGGWGDTYKKERHTLVLLFAFFFRCI